MSWPGLPARRVDQRRAPATAATAPGSSSTIRVRVIIVTGAGDGVFVYAPGTTPALGNPPIAWMGGGLVDPFGNVLPSTTGIAASGTFQAGDTIITPSGVFIYGGAPAFGNLFASITVSDVTDEFGNVTGLGFATYGTGRSAFLTSGVLQFNSTAGSTDLFSNSNGTLAANTAPGYAGTIPLTGVDTAVKTVTQATMNPLSDAWPVPANDPDSLTAYTLEVDGSGTTGTAQETLSFQLEAFGQALCPFTIGALQFPANTAFTWSLSCKIGFATPTTARARIRGSASVSGANLLTGNNTVNATIPLTAFTGLTTVAVSPAQTVELQAAWGSAAVGATISCGLQEFRRSGA